MFTNFSVILIDNNKMGFGFGLFCYCFQVMLKANLSSVKLLGDETGKKYFLPNIFC